MNLKFAEQFKLFINPYYWRSAVLIASCGVARQYRNSFLGALWLLLPSIAMMCIYTLIMPTIMHSDPRTYATYLLATLPLWTFLSVSLSSSTYSLIANAETLKRCMISSSVFPVADILKNAYSYMVGFIGMAVIALLIGLPLSWHVFLLPLYFIPVLLTVMCLCVGIAYVVPYVQDLKDAIIIAMNMLIWVSAVLYPITMLPAKAQKIMEWNPLYILLEPSITLVYRQQIPDAFVLLKLWIVMCLSLAFGYTLYRIGGRNYVYYL